MTHNTDNTVIEDLLGLMDYSTCNFMAVDAVRRELADKGFIELHEADKWEIKPQGKYYVVKNGSAIFAFVAGTVPAREAGFRIIAAHTDIFGDGGVVSLNVEKYGGGIMYTWFDRPLSVSGRVMLRGASPLEPMEVLVNFDFPLATIPHLAIHFNRAVRAGWHAVCLSTSLTRTARSRVSPPWPPTTSSTTSSASTRMRSRRS